VNFQDLLAKISTGAQIAQAAEPAIATFSTDHVAGTQQLLQIGGAAFAAETADATGKPSQEGQEAMAAAQLASNLVPMVFQFWSLFGHKKVPVVVAQPAKT